MKKNKKGYTFIKKIKYLLDDFVSRGVLAQTALLVGVSVTLTLLFGLVTWKLGQPDYQEGYWVALMHMIDQGTITADSAGTDAYFMFMLFVTLVGMAFTGTIVAIVNNAIQTKLDDLKKGHSAVIERNHVVVLGFDEDTYTICREIGEGSRANGNRVCMVVADDYPKEQMEHAAKEYHGGSAQFFEKYSRKKKSEKNISILFRSGDPVSENTLSICNVQEARAIVINREDDLETIRIILAVAAYLKKKHAYIGDEKMPSVVAMIHDRDNLTAAREAAGITAAGTGKKKANEYKVRILHSRKALARLFAQACIQQGLPFVMDGLFNYVGSSIRIEEEGEQKGEKSPFYGKTLPEIREMLEDSIPLGFVRSPEGEARPEVLLCPGENVRYGAEDRLIYLSEGMDPEIGKAETAEPVGVPAAGREELSRIRRNFLLIGENSSAPEMIARISENCGAGSSVSLITAEPGSSCMPENTLFRFAEHSCEDVRCWKEVKPLLDAHEEWFARESSERLTNIVLLALEDEEPLRADEKLMALLLNLRLYLKERGITDISLTSEMHLPQNQLLLQNNACNDFVVASEITNRMMAQIAEDPRKYYIVENLLKQESGVLELHPLSAYADTSGDFNFEFVFRSAAALGKAAGSREIPLGWVCIGQETAEKTAEEEEETEENKARPRLVLNPSKEEREQIRRGGNYGSYRLIVLAGRNTDKRNT